MRRARLLWLLCVAALTGCELDKQSVSVQAGDVVVHAVLDPGAPFQEILLERTLTGTVTIGTNIRFDPLDPINTGNGVPVAGASVTIAGPDGTLVGLEKTYTNKTPGYGAGRYEVPAGFGAAKPIRPGATYTLTVKSRDGGVVTGTTTIPQITPVTAPPKLATFNRDRDTLRLDWNLVPFARLYGIRIESPFGAFSQFSDSTHLLFAGDFRNLYSDDFQKLFIPGFQQVVTLYAADVNYFDYYRSRNDPFTGSGIINHLAGGIGLFGATVTIDSRTLDVTQQAKDPSIEGDYEYVSGPAQQKLLVDLFHLYVESGTTTTASLSGYYFRDRTGSARDGVAGTRDGTRIELQFQQNQDVHSTLVRFTGTQVADSLIGSYSAVAGRVVFRRRR
jgi:hypothetical protein